MRKEDGHGASSSLLMRVLQREVETLSDEVMRLRLMVYHIVESSHAPLPLPHPSAAPDVETNCVAHARTDELRAAAPHSLGDGGSKNTGCSTQQPVVMPPKTIQLLEQLLVASREITAASSALRRERGVRSSESPRQPAKPRRRKSRHRHRLPSSDSSFTDSSWSSPSSSSSSSVEYKMKTKKRRGLRNQEKSRKEKRHHTSASKIDTSVLASDGCPCNAEDGTAVIQKHATISKDKLHNTSNSSSARPKTSDKHSASGMCTMPLDAAGGVSASPNASCTKMSSYFGSFITPLDQKNSTDERKPSFGVMASSESNEEEERNKSSSTDENGYPFFGHRSIHQIKRTPTTANTEQVEEEEEEDKGSTELAQLKPVGLSRAVPVQRPSLLSRLRETSDESSVSSRDKTTTTSALRPVTGTEYSSVIGRDLINDVFGLYGTSSVTESHFRGPETGMSPQSNVLEASNEYNTISRNSFEQNPSDRGPTASGGGLSSPMHYRNASMYHVDG